MNKQYFVVRDLESDIALAYGWLNIVTGSIVQYDDSIYPLKQDYEWLDHPDSLLPEEKEAIVYPE